MKTLITLTGLAGFVLTWPASAFDKIEDHNKRFVGAGAVLSEIMQTPDKGIPQDLLAKANAAIVKAGEHKEVRLSLSKLIKSPK